MSKARWSWTPLLLNLVKRQCRHAAKGFPNERNDENSPVVYVVRQTATAVTARRPHDVAGINFKIVIIMSNGRGHVLHEILLLDAVLRDSSVNSFTCNIQIKHRKSREKEPQNPFFCRQDKMSVDMRARAAASEAAVCFSVPEQNVPGGLIVSGASSSLQVTGESSRTAVLGVWAAHSLLNSKEHLFNKDIYSTTGFSTQEDPGTIRRRSTRSLSSTGLC